MARSITVIPASQPYRVGGRTQQKTRNLRVAAYCRVSTDQEEQLNSFENQVEYYTKYIQDNPLYQMAGIYADEGISGTNTKKREEFKRMIRDCEEGKIDLVITKSISRFARNTQDCLEYSRRLKNLGIGIFFEKEHINTLDASGELLFPKWPRISGVHGQEYGNHICHICLPMLIPHRFRRGEKRM